jgi:hypothetical protein
VRDEISQRSFLLGLVWRLNNFQNLSSDSIVSFRIDGDASHSSSVPAAEAEVSRLVLV